MFGREVWTWKRIVKRFEFGGVLLGDLSQGSVFAGSFEPEEYAVKSRRRKARMDWEERKIFTWEMGV